MTKRHLFCITLGLALILALPALAGCEIGPGSPPEYSVHNPNAIPDGSGGAIVVYQTNTGNRATTYVQRLGANGEFLWGNQGIELGLGLMGFAANQGEFASLVTDKPGNITVVYSQDNDIWATKLDMEGNPVWEGESVRKVSPASVPERAYFDFNAIGNPLGETVMAWVPDNDHISIQKSDSNFSYFVSVPTLDLDHFDIASDDGGNVFILWKNNYGYSEGNIFVQKLDINGQAAWSAGGVRLNSPSNPGSVSADLERMITSDSEGGAIAVWVQGTLSEDGRLITGSNLHAQHINSEGETLWGENGVSIATNALEPIIVGDNSENTTIFGSDLHNIYARQLDAEGNISWPESGINVGSGGDNRNFVYYYAVSDGTGGAVVVWNYEENDKKSIHAQRIDSRGNKLWGDNGIEVSTLPPYWAGYGVPARVASDGTGGFVVTWASGNNIKDRTSSYIQRISPDGKLLWGEDGIKLNP